MSFDEAAAAALFPSMARSAAAAPTSAETPKTDADRAAKMFTGPTKYVSPWGNGGKIGRPPGDYPAEQPKPAQPAQAPQQQQPQQPQQQPQQPQQQAEKPNAGALAAELGLEGELGGEAATTFAELGLNAEAVQKLQALQAKHTAQTWDTMAAEWTKASQAEFDRSDLDAARMVIAEHGDAELKGLLDQYGLGSHPAVIRFVRNVARARR